MNFPRELHLCLTSFVRAIHRHGFGIQSPSDYELVRDVLFEKLHYYAYNDLNLQTEGERQLWRIRNHFGEVVVIETKGEEATKQYEQAMQSKKPVIVIEETDDENATLWNIAMTDERATITFDMGKRGLIVVNDKRIKQNYIL